MPVNVEEVINLLGTLCDDAELRVTVREATRGGVIAGVATVFGGLLFGPPGLAVGGTLGGLTAAYLARGTFKPVSSVLCNMEDSKKQILYQQAMHIVRNLSFQDIVTLNALVMGNFVIGQQLVECCVKHLRDEHNIKIYE